MTRYYRYSPRGFGNEIFTYAVQDHIDADEWHDAFDLTLTDEQSARFREIDEEEAGRLGHAPGNDFGRHYDIR